MTKVKATTANRKKLLLWLFISMLTVVSNNAYSCDATGFIFEEFGLRCQRLSEYIKDLQIARKMDFPMAVEKRQKLLNEWVAFYLDHGNGPPASFTLMTDQNWKRTLTRAGETIGQFAYERIPPEQAEAACIPFDLLTQQPKMTTVMTLLASWSARINESPGETAGETSEWIRVNLGFFFELNRALGQGYPEELKRSRELIRFFNQQWKFVVEAPANTGDTIYRFTRNDLVEKLRKEFERWRVLCFM